MHKEEELKTLLEDLEISEEVFEKLSNFIKEQMEALHQSADDFAELKVQEALEEAKVEGETAVETALEEQAEIHKSEIEEICKKAEDYAEYVKEQMIENVQGYVDHVVEKFVSENEEKFLMLEDYDRIKDSFDMIKEAFEKNGFTLNEDLQTTELKSELKDAEESYNELFTELMESKSELKEMKKILIYEQKTKDLTETQRAKLNKLITSTNIDEDEGIFEEKLGSLMENIELGSGEPTEKLTEEYDPPAVNDNMKRYLDKL